MSQTVLHKASSRGHANHGWLDSHHTFSFAGYYNPERVHFGALRVLNDDVVQGGKGFGTHPHDNMEIISIPLKGALKHRDNTGRQGIISTGDVQIMSAGTGIAHSEYNASETDDVNFLQIWIFPKKRNIQPFYDQKTLYATDRENKWQVVVAPEENNGALKINQDAWISLGSLKKGQEINYQIKQNGNGVYVFVIEGDISIEGQQLNKRDGLGMRDVKDFSVKAGNDAEILLLEIPMDI